jgi:ketosteroid isomerase-like protein
MAVSQENVEIVRRFYEHIGREGELMVGLLDEDVEFDFAWMHGRGADAWRRAIAEWAGTFEEWRIEAREVIDVGPSQLIAIVRDRARAKGSGAEIDNEFAHLWTIREGLVIRFEAFTTKADALQAAELEE